MTPSPPLARRSNTLSSSLGLGEKLFASSEERAFAAAIEKGLEEVEAGLLKEMTFADVVADVTTRYLLEAGGKRVRPTLTLLTAQLGTGNNPSVITAAEAVEITHLASLYHDDVMDEAQMRRGVPSAQTVWGNSVAILTGDLLFARASSLVASLGERALTIQSDTFERLVLGQLHETLGPRDRRGPDRPLSEGARRQDRVAHRRRGPRRRHLRRGARRVPRAGPAVRRADRRRVPADRRRAGSLRRDRADGQDGGHRPAGRRPHAPAAVPAPTRPSPRRTPPSCWRASSAM